MSGAPLEITLYDPVTNEEIKTYTRSFLPWKLLKTAIRLSKGFDAENLSEKDLDQLAGLVVDVFGNQFSVEDLNNGSDVGEMATVLQAIMTRASSLMPANPTRPGS
jgi:23S rRNA G2069 N7-methylase RlmK/C1962 C5-methylase RlmI